MKRWSMDAPEPRYPYDVCASCCYLGQVDNYDLYACEARCKFEVRWGSGGSRRRSVALRKGDSGLFLIPFDDWMAIPEELKASFTLAIDRMNDMHNKAPVTENKFAGALERLNE